MEGQVVEAVQLCLLCMPELVVELLVVAEAGQLLLGELVCIEQKASAGL